MPENKQNILSLFRYRYTPCKYRHWTITQWEIHKYAVEHMKFQWSPHYAEPVSWWWLRWWSWFSKPKAVRHRHSITGRGGAGVATSFLYLLQIIADIRAISARDNGLWKGWFFWILFYYRLAAASHSFLRMSRGNFGIKSSIRVFRSFWMYSLLQTKKLLLSQCRCIF